MDERFTAVVSDPRFRSLKKSEKKVKVDKRFHGMFREERFKTKSCDKRGKILQEDSSEKLHRFYELTSESDDESELNKKDEQKKSKVPDARGENNDDFSESSSDDEISEDENEVDHEWGELDKEVMRSEAVSNRLAICNIDWDRIKAVDIFVLVNSFKPNEGSIVSVKIFPSEFGKQRMQEESLKGPKELVEVTLGENDVDPFEKSMHDDEQIINDGCSYITEKLRKYQLNRLKYYYAVVECDTIETAVALYDHLDGMEYESSASALDLRFIPDKISFDETPSSECYAMPDLVIYKPPNFITTALQQSKVRLTWDETDPKRMSKMQNAFKCSNKTDDDINAYLASEISDNDESDTFSDCSNTEINVKIEKYKSLLQSLDKNCDDEDVDVEVSWEPDLKAAAESFVNEKQNEKDTSVFQKERRKKKNKRKIDDTSEETHAGVVDEEEFQTLDLVSMEDEQKDHFNFQNIIEKQKGKNKDSIADDFQVDVDDNRFSAIYTSSAFSIDQSNPNFRRTNGMNKLLHQKQKYKQKKMKTDEDVKDNSLCSLINSVKSKTKNNKRFEKR
ncbi:ESF1-like protein [Leptotrombidium deliense]|uniref:ESF1-like protein n=1 Tax=Leptotrombidium deliense TaxID=299467 RepID=A0A443SAY0_9ACAR|nr:ESF1-like protein [Leptotrombidium deliense]